MITKFLSSSIRMSSTSTYNEFKAHTHKPLSAVVVERKNMIRFEVLFCVYSYNW